MTSITARYVYRNADGSINDTVTHHMSHLGDNHSARRHFAEISRPGDYLEREIVKVERIFERGAGHD